MVITGESIKVANAGRGCIRAAFVIFLTTILILSACSGGGGGGPPGPAGMPGISGRICLTSETSYNVSVDGEEARDVQAETASELITYNGNIGGQVRAAEKIDISFAGQPVNEILAWGSGAAIKYGNTEAVAGTIRFSRPGAVMDLSNTKVDGTPVIVYAAERGMGLIVAKDGALQENTDTYYPIPAGALSISANGDGSVIVFATRDGYLHKTSISKLLAKESCTDVIASSNALKVSDRNYFPFKAKVGDRYAFVLAKESGTVPSIAPTFGEIYDPIFSAMLRGSSSSIVRAINISDNKMFDVGMSTADGSFHYYDNFIPTDIALNEGTLFVAGLAFRSSSIQSFVAENCAVPDEGAQLNCLATAAKDARLTLFQENGISAMTAGMFVYRNLDDLSKATHFTLVPLTAFQHSEAAPPFVFAAAIEGGRGYMRGPNFLVSLNRSSSSATSETWTITSSADIRGGLQAGIPNDVAMFGGGAVSSFTAIRDSYGAGASSIEFSDPMGQSKLLDTGSIYTKVDGASGSFLAAVEMTSGRGGNLYIENMTSRTPISDFEYPNAYVAQAAYSGQVVAIAWSSTGTGDTTDESAQNLRIVVQDGANKQTRGVGLSLPRSDLVFSGFPGTSSGDPKPWLTRGVADIALGANQRMAVLFGGFASGTWYHRVGLYGYAKESGTYTIVPLGSMTLLNSQGVENDLAGKILGIAQNAAGTQRTVYFSTADGVYGWTVTEAAGATTESGSAVRIIQASSIADASLDAGGGNKVAIAAGDAVIVRDISNPAASGQTINIARREGGTRPSLVGGRVALKGSVIAVVAPYAALDPFAVFTLSGGAFTPAMTCATCAFLDVKMFGSLGDYLVVSSASSGIEIYKINGR